MDADPLPEVFRDVIRQHQAHLAMSTVCIPNTGQGSSEFNQEFPVLTWLAGDLMLLSRKAVYSELSGWTSSTAAQCGFCLIFLLIRKRNLIGTLNLKCEGNVPPAGHLRELF